ncbi:unnamed protein product [Chondrus crispus]|uniref:Glycosyl transferase family 1 domain-containing protein n=1 Tax=Chondrus crispus TaxID=2769 RepID=R7QIN3_CHOCR|nr:unnamed protein product [Chondrus crispus]CDF37336.1 unnamed protein product [Chondrus crispus]|eukprot:XP_005717155.1 unnamed protein product [Chondrus crispus]
MCSWPLRAPGFSYADPPLTSPTPSLTPPYQLAMVIVSRRRLVYLSLEYCQPDLFSGSGIAARAQVRGFAAKNVSVVVICGRPAHTQQPEPARRNVKVISVPLDKWGTTDRCASHQQYAEGVARILGDGLGQYDAILAVDWTAANAVRLFLCHGGTLKVPMIYLSFRVYCSMTGISRDDARFYREEEAAAVDLALTSGGGVVALCDMDFETLSTLRTARSHPADKLPHQFAVIPPMLRDEFSNIAKDDEDQILDFPNNRMYLVSLVRLSRDKGPHRFVKLLQNLQQKDPDIWERTGVVPLICGSHSQPHYADRILRELRSAVPHSVVIDKFLTPEELAVVLKNSVLNIHPAEYEAYGMTIIEAAAMGCPTVLNRTGIGATQLLDPKNKACAAVDVTDEVAFANTVRRLLEDAPRRQQLAHSAFLHATSWTEAEHVRALLAFTQDTIVRNS